MRAPIRSSELSCARSTVVNARTMIGSASAASRLNVTRTDRGASSRSFEPDLPPFVAADGDGCDHPRGAEDVGRDGADVRRHLGDIVPHELASQLLHPGQRGRQRRTIDGELAVLHRQRHASLLGHGDERTERGLLLIHRFRLVDQQPHQPGEVAREGDRVVYGQVVSLRRSPRRRSVECCTVPS